MRTDEAILAEEIEQEQPTRVPESSGLQARFGRGSQRFQTRILQRKFSRNKPISCSACGRFCGVLEGYLSKGEGFLLALILRKQLTFGGGRR